MATITIDVNDLPGRLAEAAARAAGGDEVIVSGGDGVAVKLVPVNPPPGQRRVILGLHPGSMVPAPDFDDPLPDEFWLSGDP